MSRRLPVLAIGLFAAACAEAPESTNYMIVDPRNDSDMVAAQSARWIIETYDGYGIPGSPEANVVVPNARGVLQGIIDACRLGATRLLDATDGVMILSIDNPNLTSEQIQCVRAAERPGLTLRDQRTGS